MHALLQRQLRRLGFSCDALPEDHQAWGLFLERVDKAYADADQERYLLERSLELSGKEMTELYESLRRSSATEIAAARDRLHSVITALSDGLCAVDKEGRLIFLTPAAAGLPGEVVVPGQHEPRAPRSHGRRDRDERPAAGYRPVPRAAALRRDDQVVRGGTALDRERHPGLLQDRGGPAGTGAHRLRPANH